MWRHLLLIAAFLVAMPLHAADVQTDYDSSVDLGKVQHYQWLKQTDGIDAQFSTLTDDMVREILTSSLDRQLQPASDKFPADVLVRYYIRPVKKLVDDRPRLGIGIGGFGSNVGGGVSLNFPLGGNDLDQQAHVVIDFLDPKTKRLIWRGSIVTGLSSKSSSTNQKQLQKAADAILRKFPPG